MRKPEQLSKRGMDVRWMVVPCGIAATKPHHLPVVGVAVAVAEGEVAAAVGAVAILVAEEAADAIGATVTKISV